MNQEHLRLCASAEWAALVRDDLLPWVLGDDELGDDVLEIGAGPGLVTDLLVERAHRVTAVEIDEHLAAALRRRLAGRPVEVMTADASALPLPDGRFSSAACSRCCITFRDVRCRIAPLPRSPGSCDQAVCLSAQMGRTPRRAALCTSATCSSRSIRRASRIGSGPPGSSTPLSRATATAFDSGLRRARADRVRLVTQ